MVKTKNVGFHHRLADLNLNLTLTLEVSLKKFNKNYYFDQGHLKGSFQNFNGNPVLMETAETFTFSLDRYRQVREICFSTLLDGNKIYQFLCRPRGYV